MKPFIYVLPLLKLNLSFQAILAIYHEKLSHLQWSFSENTGSE